MTAPDAIDWNRGYVQVYTGDGKGKTTAALGLAALAAGAGLRVYMAQFAKGRDCSELAALKRFDDLITVRQFGESSFIHEPRPQDVAAARAGLAEAKAVLESGQHRLVILDEANIAVHFNLFTVDDLLALIAAKPQPVELVITGRRAHERIIERAELVTEMRQVKHYYEQSVKARVGIEK